MHVLCLYTGIILVRLIGLKDGAQSRAVLKEGRYLKKDGTKRGTVLKEVRYLNKGGT